MSRPWSIALVIVAAVLFLLTTVGFWVRTSVLDEDSFVTLSTRSLTAEEVRLAIANRIVDAALEDRPIVRNFVRDPASEIISGVLGTSFVEGVLERISRLMYALLVFNDGDRVAINLEPIRNFVVNIINVLSPEGTPPIDVEQIPSEIVIIEEGAIPPIQDYIVAIEWLTLLLGVASIGLLALVLWKSWSTAGRNSYLKWFGGSLAVGALILGLLTWTVGSTAALTVQDQTGRVIISETYDNLVAQLRVQSFGLVVIGIGIWLSGWWMLRDSAGARSRSVEVADAGGDPAHSGVVAAEATPSS